MGANLMEENSKTIKPKKRPVKKKKQPSIPTNLIGISVGGIVFLGILFVAFQLFVEHKNTNHKMIKLSRELIDLKSAMNVDSVRQYQLQKIMNIIYTHNEAITSAEAYDIASSVYNMAVKYTNLNVDLLCAVITHESANSWNAKVTSPAGAMGLMQIMPITGMFLANAEGVPWTTPEDVLFDPVYNIRLGSRYLSALIAQYDLDGGLAAYNGGERQVAIWLANDKDYKYLWKETQKYVPAVQKLYETYLNSDS